jgi:hypothetical protein
MCITQICEWIIFVGLWYVLHFYLRFSAKGSEDRES